MLAATKLTVATVIAACLALLLTRASAQPASPAYASFDFGPVAGRRSTASWSSRAELYAFRTSTSLSYYVPSGAASGNLTTAPAGSFLLVGGTADIYISTDGFNWNFVAGPAGSTVYQYVPTAWTTTFTYEIGQAICKSPNSDRLFLMRDQRVWVSTDGHTFTLYNAVGVPNRWYYPCVIDSNDVVYSIDGSSTYASSDNGLSWVRKSTAPWTFSGRTSHSAASYFSSQAQRNIIYVTAGYPKLNDVWATSDGAVTWSLLSANAPWPGRFDARLYVTSAGVIVIAGGRPDYTNGFNDVWTSLDGGYNWWLVRSHASYTPRIQFGAVTDANGYLWMFGGYQYAWVSDAYVSSYSNGIARSSLSFNDVLTWLPKINRDYFGPTTSSCLGLVCWPSQSCDCSLPNDLNFNRLGLASFAPRSQFGFVQTMAPITYNTPSGSATASAGSYIVYGGSSASPVDGFISSDLLNWTPLYGTAAIAAGLVNNTDFVAPKHADGQSACAYTSATETVLYLMGGGQPVYRSTNGQTWSIVSSVLTERNFGDCVVLSDRTTVLSFHYNNIGRSTDSGVTWTGLGTSAVNSRLAPAVALVPASANLFGSDLVYVMGGIDYTFNFNDVWVSSDKGSSFNFICSTAPWAARQNAVATVSSSGAIVLMSGFAYLATDWYNDAWVTLDGGYRWYPLSNSDDISPRYFPGILIDSTGLLVSIGGTREIGGLINDVYRSDSRYSFNSLSSWIRTVVPKVKIPACYGLTHMGGDATSRCPEETFFNLISANATNLPFGHSNFEVIRTKNSRTLTIGANGETSLSLPANSWVVWGGSNDVWVSTNKAQGTPSWQQAAGTGSTVPPNFRDSFTSRAGSAYCANLNTDLLFSLGGMWSNEIWRSTDGQDWIIAQQDGATGSTAWPTHAYFLCTVDPSGLLYAVSGYLSSGSLIDDNTYVSADNGETWSVVSTSTPFPQRVAFFGGGVWNSYWGKHLIYAAGGIAGRNFNDVWVTRDGAKNWVLLTANAPWPARADTMVTFHEEGAMVLYGGQRNTFERWFSDVWVSLDGGYNWYQLSASANSRPRALFATEFDENGYLWIFGGVRHVALSNSIIRSTHRFNTASLVQWLPAIVNSSSLVLPTKPTGEYAFGLSCWPGVACSFATVVDSSSSSSTGGSCASSLQSASSSSSLSGGAIAGIVIGSIAGGLLLGLILAFAFGVVGRSAKADGHSTFAPHNDVEMSSNAHPEETANEETA